VAAAAVVIITQVQRDARRDALAAATTAAPVTTTASLAARPTPQINFVGELEQWYPALTASGAWEGALDAAENTCRSLQGTTPEERDPVQWADTTAQRFSTGGLQLQLMDGERVLQLMDTHRVCASFGMA
jgi:hypothetical protein